MDGLKSFDYLWRINERSVPATCVLDREGIVRAGQADPDCTVRMEPAEIVAAIRNIVAGSG